MTIRLSPALQTLVVFIFVVANFHLPVFSSNDASTDPCVDGRNAPALIQYRWYPKAKISIRFRAGDFLSEEFHALQTPIHTWQKILSQSATGITLQIDSLGTDDDAVDGVILIKRQKSFTTGHLAEIHATHIRDGYISGAIISLEPSVTNTTVLRRLIAHEFGHAFGLADCPSCANNSSIMNIFRQVKVNGIGLGSLFMKVADTPSRCDVSAMSRGYETLKPGADQTVMAASMAVLEDHNDQRGIVAETLAVEKLDAAQLDTSAPETGTGKTLVDEAISIKALSLPVSDPRVQSLARQETSSIKALQQFAFKRDVLIQTLDRKGKVTGEYRRISQMVLDDSGNRIEKIISFSKPTLKRLIITKEDIEDIAGTQMLGLEASRIDRYLISNAGHQIVDGRDYLLLRITPADLARAKIDHERVFNGLAWVDPNTMQIVKLKGRALPEGNQRFPMFETMRASIDKTHFFPVSTYADDVLEFPGFNIRMRMSVRYSEFKKFTSDVKISDDDEISIDSPE